MILLLLFLFFLSGAAALVYEVVWMRSLSLVLGGSHLAVTVVLAVYMGGLALGSWQIGKRVERSDRPLRIYGLLELGVGAFALVFAGLMRLYPLLYVPLARLGETSPLWLFTIRVLFACAALIVPTTLMGGTLPVLARFAAGRGGALGRPLSLLYGVNTFGAMAGSLAAGFLLLPRLGVTRTLAIAVATNLAVGLTALACPERSASGSERPRAGETDVPDLPARLVLWGIGVSGFCALGYEVLWTRVLSSVVGTSVYSFTIMLVAFLAGIALGSQALPLVTALVGRAWRPTLLAFAAVQGLIGVTALATTYALRDLPTHAGRLQAFFASGGSEFAARQGASFVLAFAFMAAPAFFMGLAFPLAGVIHARSRRSVGEAIGEVLAFNTVGAILGAAAGGFLLIRLLGIESSLQVLSLVNLALAIVVGTAALDAHGRKGALASVVAGVAGVALIALPIVAPGRTRMWDRKFFAVFRNNQRAAFDSPEKIKDALENTDVLYYHEGINETISVIRPRRAAQALIVNGRSEATTHLEDIQCQRTLGHLPMLAHPSPKRVFVLGLGTGMTLGATSIYPEAERITLAEIETGVFGAARTFGEYNHHVLDNPKLEIVHDDGRNYLRTTAARFDVITADPIHPWSGGASYLYTTEYFRAAAEHLNPGGVLCQWLPIYELTTEDVRSVVATFAESFRSTALWLTYYDAELLGSDSPLRFDEAALARRFANPEIARDLAAVEMGTPRDFLSYQLLGDAGVRAFAEGGVLNTDDNVSLEFSSPRSQGIEELTARNVEALTAHRESTLDAAARGYDRAHALALYGRFEDPEFDRLVTELGSGASEYAPMRFLAREQRVALGATPRPLFSVQRPVAPLAGRATLELTAVTMRVGEGRAAVLFVDNASRKVFGQRYLDAPEEEIDARMEALARAVLETVSREASDGGGIPERFALEARLGSRIPQILESVAPPERLP